MMSEYVQILKTYAVILLRSIKLLTNLTKGQPLGLPSLICIPEVIINHFYLKLVGNIRVYQRCRGYLKLVDGRIHAPPHDIVVVRFERRPVRDQSGSLRPLVNVP